MTKSLGVRAAQRRREELFSAEMTLRKAWLHLLGSVAWARRMGDCGEVAAQVQAIGEVTRCLSAVLQELADLR